MKRYKSTTILGGGPPGKIVQCQSFEISPRIQISQILVCENIILSLASIVIIYEIKSNISVVLLRFPAITLELPKLVRVKNGRFERSLTREDER